ncbi:MAPEG family protein [Roseibium sp. RKSG952]|uniref:MAPEG family protein n=1 Tax=Roseibium sp. RKSG952 TaxID=2529384 RepID=UPI0012BC3C25|nr:MAPEG family protein [Roseibium sp. RKSG952]MTH99683.1 hypothetical protein [Roseibium sp. RKSG952]
MAIAIWCILAAAILPIVTVFPAKLSKEFDNTFPRNPEYWKEGFRARAQGAQANGFEAFPFFAIAVIVGIGQGGDPYWIDQLALLFIAMRVLYILCYWSNRATPRSIAWTAGFFATVAIFSSPVWS